MLLDINNKVGEMVFRISIDLIMYVLESQTPWQILASSVSYMFIYIQFFLCWMNLSCVIWKKESISWNNTNISQVMFQFLNLTLPTWLDFFFTHTVCTWLVLTWLNSTELDFLLGLSLLDLICPNLTWRNLNRLDSTWLDLDMGRLDLIWPCLTWLTFIYEKYQTKKLN